MRTPALTVLAGLLALPLTPAAEEPLTSARQTAQLIRSGELTSEAAVTQALARLARDNPRLNAVRMWRSNGATRWERSTGYPSW